MATSSTNPTLPQSPTDWQQPGSKPWLREPTQASPFDLFLQVIQPPPSHVICPPATTDSKPPAAELESEGQPSELSTADEAPPAPAERADEPSDQSNAGQAEAIDPAAQAEEGHPGDKLEEPAESSPEVEHETSADVVVQALAGVAATTVNIPVLDPAVAESAEATPETAVAELEIAPAGHAPPPVAALLEVVEPTTAAGALADAAATNETLAVTSQAGLAPDPLFAAAYDQPTAPQTTIAQEDVPAESPTPLELPAVAVAGPEELSDEAHAREQPEEGPNFGSPGDHQEDQPRARGAQSAIPVEVPAALVPAESANQSTAPDKAPTQPTAATPQVTITATEAPYARLPVDLLARRPAESRPAASAQAESIRLLSRVARAFAVAEQRGGEVTLRLSPPELGSLRVEVQVRDNALVARVEAETMDAQATILENLSALRERLADQGVRIERFEVNLTNRQGGGAPQHSFDHPRETPRTPQPAAAAVRTDDSPNQTPTALTSSTAVGRLNVVI